MTGVTLRWRTNDAHATDFALFSGESGVNTEVECDRKLVKEGGGLVGGVCVCVWGESGGEGQYW